MCKSALKTKAVAYTKNIANNFEDTDMTTYKFKGRTYKTMRGLKVALANYYRRDPPRN